MHMGALTQSLSSLWRQPAKHTMRCSRRLESSKQLFRYLRSLKILPPPHVLHMLKTLISPSDYREFTAQLSSTAIDSSLYSALSKAIRLTDISADARCVVASGYRLVRVDARDSSKTGLFEIALLSDVSASVPFYALVEVASIPELSPRAVAQSLMWRSPDVRHAVATRDVTHDVFFNYIAKRYNIILSGNQEIGQGWAFWQRQVSLAIAYGLCVSYQMATQPLQPIPTQESLNNLVEQLWAEAHERNDHLVLISETGHLTERLSVPSGWQSQRKGAPKVPVEG